jgi:hypothetical protein
MTDARKLMGRLAPAVMNYEAARGGIPEMTAQDIAAAMGIVRYKDELAAEVFCCCWWPDGGKLTADKLDARLRSAVLAEYSRRHLEAVMAKLDCHIAEGEYEYRRFKSDEDRRAIAVARAKRSRADAQKWPWNVDVYGRLCSAVMSEIRDRNLCPDCKGRRFLATDSVPVACARCNSTGQIAASKVTRAKALGISEAGYRLVWSYPYDWAYAEISALERKACSEFTKALGIDDDNATSKAAA